MVAANRIAKYLDHGPPSLSESEPVRDNPNWWPVAVLVAFLAGWFIGRGN